ncbi:MAG: hypothetical protein JHC26_06185 [Thermofilum sp.]|jgi:ABC-type transporter Mla subunit MlaD|nr:hypothetical protein [Thermofilum sp.]MCI4408660.1 hypothetical protein [Thermofilum sp.]
MREKLLRVVAVVLFVFLVVFVAFLVLELGRYMVEITKEYNATFFLNK